MAILHRENCFCADDHASWPMNIFRGVYDMIHFGLIRRCMSQPPFTRGIGNLRALTLCLAFSLAATDSMVYRPSLHQRWAVLPSSPSGTTGAPSIVQTAPSPGNVDRCNRLA